jgi:hypothetical protein
MTTCDLCEDREACVYTVRMGMNLFICDFCEDLLCSTEQRVVEAIRFNYGLGPIGSISSLVPHAGGGKEQSS